MTDRSPSSASRRLDLALILTLALAAAACDAGGGGESTPAPPSDEGPTAEEQAAAERMALGRELYLEHCAGCHGERGDGKGTTKLERPARSFAEGGFAFGNTREALFRTITIGMPGMSQMQAFKDELSDDERRAVIDFLLTLMPKQEKADRKARIMTVTDRPAVAYGILPPLADGLPKRGRGLLVGYPEGLTFEYRIDDVRLLAVRQGAFADREDWDHRGGSPLRPLGKVIHLFEGGDPGPAFHVIAGNERRPLAAAMRGSHVDGGTAGVRYRLLDGDRPLGVEVTETHRVEASSAGSGFTRRLALRLVGEPITVVFDVMRSERELALSRVDDRLRGWIVRPEAEGRSSLWRLRLPPDTSPMRDASSLSLALRLVPGVPAEVAITTVPAATWSDEMLETLEGELGP